MIPSVENQKTDGNLGVATETDRILAIVGVAKAGAFDTPQAFTSKNDILDEHEEGPLVEAGVYCVARGIPVVLVRANPATAATYGVVDDAGVTGTAIVAAGATAPTGDYDVVVEILTGGALGTTGIIYRDSLDDGVNFSDPKSLGTSLTLNCDGNVSFALSIATNTLIAGDTFSVTTKSAKITNTDLTDSFTALKDYAGDFLRVLVVEESSDTMLANCVAFADSFHAKGRYPEVIANTRYRDTATPETRGDYLTAMSAVIASVQSPELSVVPDQCEIVSEVSGRRLRLPQALPIAARLTLPTLDDSVDGSAKALGSLPGVFIRSADDSRQYHDEARFPGFDALGFTTLRTWQGRPATPGVYPNNMRVMSGSGSDYRYFQHSAIVNRAIEAAFQMLEPKLSMSVMVETTGARAGKIREDVAKGLEDTISAELRTQFSDPARVSGIEFLLSRNDAILSTDTVTFAVNAVPLGYIKKFKGKTGLVRKLSA